MVVCLKKNLYCIFFCVGCYVLRPDRRNISSIKKKKKEGRVVNKTHQSFVI